MYIPVSLASGATTVDCTVPLSGDLIAACSVIYKGTTYQPGVTIPVKQGDVVRLSTTVTAYAEISVQLGGKQYYWFVDLPKTLRYISDLAYQRLTGSTYGKLTHYPSGVQVPYTDSGTFAVGDSVASIDFVKKEVWFFNAAGNVKKVALTTVPVAVIYAPRWALADGVQTVPYIVTKSQIIRLTTAFAIDTPFTITDGVVAASGDVDGNLVLAYATSLVRWSPSTTAVVNTITNADLDALHGLYVLSDNSYITFGNGGIKKTALNGASYATTVLVPLNGTYISADSNSTDLYVVDGANRCVIKLKLADNTYTIQYFPDVPRSVTVKDTTLYVGFFDVASTATFALDFTGRADIATTKTYGATYLADYVVTDLYSDAAAVTTAEAAVTPVIVQPADFTWNTAITYTWTCPWTRAEYVKLATSPDATVKLNGVAWTGGYLRFGDKLVITMPATTDWYYDRWVTLMGRRATSIMLRTQPKLFPDAKSLPQINNAVPKFEYLSPTYVIAGITEGFTADVTSNAGEAEVSFSINGGDFGYTGTIKNGDVIQVRSLIQNLRPTRNTHDTHAAGDNVVYSITILPMVLNGVERRQEKTDLRNRYDGMYGGGQSIAAQDAMVGEHMLQGTLVSLDRGLDAAYQSNPSCLPEMTVPTALRLTTGSVQRTRLGVPTATRSYSTILKSAESSPEGVVLSTRIQKLDWDYSALKQLQGSPVLYQDEAQFAGYQFGGHWAHIPEVEAVRNEQSHYWTLVADAAKRDTNFTFWAGQQWLRVYAEKPYPIDTAWSKAMIQHVEKINTEIGKWVLQHVEYQDAAYDGYTLRHVEKIGTEWAAYTLRHVEYQDVIAIPRTLLNRQFADIVVQGYQLYHREEIGPFEFLRPDIQKFQYISAAYQSNQVVTRDIDAMYYWNQVREATGIDMVYERHHPTAIEVAKAEPMFAVASQDWMLPEEQSGFGSRAQAQAYAAEVEAQRTEFFQINGKWIFVARPEAENAMCGIIITPPEKQKRYGYVGGG